LKAEVSTEKNEDDNLTVIGTDSTSIAEGEVAESNSDERTNEPLQASRVITQDSQSTSKSYVKGKDKGHASTLKSDAKPATEDKKEAQHLTGKINNLVTTDLANIVGGVDFLVISAL
jgi:hypothetical protein